MTIINEGVHKVSKIIETFTGASSKKGTPYVGINFLLEGNHEMETALYFTDNTSDRNLKVLLDLGFIGKRLSDLSDPSKTVDDLFKSVADINVTIEHEHFDKNDGTTGVKAVIKWINVGSVGFDKVDHAKSVSIFAGLSFNGELMKMRKTHVMPELKSEIEDGVEVVDSFDDQEIPF